jgi:hypothetical protein
MPQANPASPIGSGEASSHDGLGAGRSVEPSREARPVWADNNLPCPPIETNLGAELEVGFRTPVTRTELTKAERLTLEIGFVITFAALTGGLDLGRWPLWSAPVALGGYFAWTVLYSEATIQAARWQLRPGAPERGRRLSLPAEPVSPPG